LSEFDSSRSFKTKGQRVKVQRRKSSIIPL
jgi:hypothetical protein